MSKEDKKRFLTEPHEFKVRYIYHQFNFAYKPLDKASPVITKVDLSRVYVSPHTLGLILTYYVNYGISARKTACLVKPFVDHYPYKLSYSFCGDETYIRVNRK